MNMHRARRPQVAAATKSIIHIADYAPTYSGNFIASLRTAGAECHAHGFRLVWVFPNDVKDYDWFKKLGAEMEATTYLLSRSDGTFEHARQIARIASVENASIVHTHFSCFDIAAWIAKATCALRLRRFELAWHVHSAFPIRSTWFRRVKDFLKLGVLGRSCHAVPVSEALASSLAERGFPAKRIHLVSNGIDVAHATERKTSRENVRSELRIPDGSWMLLGFGWTPIRKGVDTMLEALAILLDRKVKVVLVLAGTEELNTFLTNWPDASCKEFIRVIRPAEYVGDLFNAADMFLSPSRAEGWCYGVAEAMANGVPAVSSDIPPLAWAAHAPGVYFCPPGNGLGLADSIGRVTGLSKQEHSSNAELSNRFIAERHSVQKWGESIWSLYEELLRS
jgi:glycosyltransferase involved in cell wall biosynthesis